MLIGINRRSKSLDSLPNFIRLDELIDNKSITKLFIGEYKSLRNFSYAINSNRLNMLSEFAPDVKRSIINDFSTRHGNPTEWFIHKPLDAATGDFTFLKESDWRFLHFMSDDMPQDYYRRGYASIKRHILSIESNTTLIGFNNVFNLMADEYNPWGIPPQLANITKANKCEKVELRTKETPTDKSPEIKQGKNKRKGNPKSNPNVVWKVLLILLVVTKSDAIPLTKYREPSSLQEYTHSALSTPYCNPGNLNMTQKCQINSDLLEIHMNYCGFKSLCPLDQEPVCVNIERGMVFICAPSERICAKGYRWYPWLDKDNKTVHVKEEKCPKGSFQPYETNCFLACTMTHLNIKDLQEKFLVYSEGDNVLPTYVYCNYKKGYFNREHKFKVDYDRESMHEPYFCSHIDNFNPCFDSLVPLPNGTCVKPCLLGECRDDHDEFICKSYCRDNHLDRNSSKTAAGHSNQDVDECHDIVGLCENGKCTNIIGSYNCLCHDGYELDSSKNRCIRSGGRAEDKNTTNLPTWTIVVLTITIAIAVGATVAIVCVCFRIGLCERNSNNLQRENMSEGRVSYSATETTESSGGENNKMNGTVPINTRQSLESATDVHEQKDGTERRDEEETLLKQENMDVDEMIVNDSHVPRSTDKKAFDKVSNGNLKQRSHARAEINQGQQIENETDEGTDSQDNADLPTQENPDLRVLNGDINPLSNADLQKKDKREQSVPQSTTISNGKRFRKDFDDANTQAVIEFLRFCMMSCGALINDGKVAGTVFRVGHDFVMTAFHVIQDIVKDKTGKTSYDFSKLERPDIVTVNFNRSICVPSKRQFCLKYRFHDEETDVAVLEIMNSTELENFPQELLLWQHNIECMNVTKIHMIGYGHNENPFEKHTETCQIMNDKARMSNALKSLDKKRKIYIKDLERNGKNKAIVDSAYSNLNHPNLIKFDAYMTQGLSGAPIISNDDNSPKVIGIVLGGMPDFYYQLSEERKSSFKKKHLIEYGMKMQTIYEKMISSDEELAKQLFHIS